MTNPILNPLFQWKALHDCYRECEEKSPGNSWWVTAERNNCKWYCRLKDTHGLFKSDSQEESTPIDISSTFREIGNKFYDLADSMLFYSKIKDQSSISKSTFVDLLSHIDSTAELKC